MTELQNLQDLVSKLSNRPRHNFIYDKTETMSIVSAQSSIFDLESSMTSCDFEDLKLDSPEKKPYILPIKTRPLHFKSKKPDNWLYSNPQANTIIEHSENPVEWMRTVFDDNYMMLASKSNLKQQLSKSQGNLCNIDFDLPECVETVAPVLVSHKSVSNLKIITEHPSDEFCDYKSNMTLSKTAPGSTENVVDSRSSFQDFIAMAKKQEESLKAEVMRRKFEMSKSANNKSALSMKYIKNGHLTTPRNRFGFTGEKPLVDSSRSKSVTIRYSKVENSSSKETPFMSLPTPDHSKKLGVASSREVSAHVPRMSLPTFDNSRRLPQRSRYNITNPNQSRASVNGKTVTLYHI